MPRDKRQTTTARPLDKTRRIISCYTYTLLEILATQSSYFEHHLMMWRKPMFSKEVAVLHLTPGEKILHLGCGTLPTTSLLIAQTAPVHVVGIDNNKIAVRIAQRFIKRKNLAESITIQYGDEGHFSLNDFDAIFIAINVWPLDRVLRHLATTMKPSARILCRSNHDDVEAMLKADEFSSVFAIDSILKHPNAKSAILFRRKET